MMTCLREDVQIMNAKADEVFRDCILDIDITKTNSMSDSQVFEGYTRASEKLKMARTIFPLTSYYDKYMNNSIETPEDFSIKESPIWLEAVLSDIALYLDEKIYVNETVDKETSSNIQELLGQIVNNINNVEQCFLYVEQLYQIINFDK